MSEHAMKFEAIERGLKAMGVPAEKARSAALAQFGIFTPPAPPKRRQRSIQEPVSIPASDPSAGRWEFLLPMPDPQTNGSHSRAHWSKKSKARADYLALCAFAGTWPPVPAAPLERATLAVVMYLGNRMDQDGAMARCKLAVDQLVSRGYLRNDDAAHLTWTGFPTQVVSRKHVYAIHLTLTEIR